MANRYSRPTVSRARQRAMQRKQLLIGGGALAAMLLIALVILLIPKAPRTDSAVEVAAQVTPEPVAAEPAAPVEEIVVADTPVPTPVPTPEPTPEPVQEAASLRALTRPTPTAQGFMPVFSKADTEEKIVAITVDDCFQAENLQQIVDKAIEVGGKLTIFPIGQNVLKEKQSQILKYAWENGFELENHTFTHNGLFYATNEELADEIYQQQMALSYILGVEYQCHFLRPRGGDARGDQRLQMYARQMGYYGIAHWSVSGSSSDEKIAKGLKPGAIFLFHTTNTDLDKLLRFIPWVVEQGYQLVTLNEMFDYPANEFSELTTPANGRVSPALEPYEMVYVPLKKTTYSWETWLFQEKLIALGYLTGEPDGVYGDGCVAAVKAYQRDHGLEQTGVADSDLVRAVIEGTA
ncbi:MAG: polysaccharide deacetylase family protein [Clostridia bacterium]|nr:polysaccharide deacetylase family protein [Clostridia bacterium]